MEEKRNGERRKADTIELKAKIFKKLVYIKRAMIKRALTSLKSYGEKCPFTDEESEAWREGEVSAKVSNVKLGK